MRKFCFLAFLAAFAVILSPLAISASELDDSSNNQTVLEEADAPSQPTNPADSSQNNQPAEPNQTEKPEPTQPTTPTKPTTPTAPTTPVETEDSDNDIMIGGGQNNDTKTPDQSTRPNQSNQPSQSNQSHIGTITIGPDPKEPDSSNKTTSNQKETKSNQTNETKTTKPVQVQPTMVNVNSDVDETDDMSVSGSESVNPEETEVEVPLTGETEMTVTKPNHVAATILLLVGAFALTAAVTIMMAEKLKKD